MLRTFLKYLLLFLAAILPYSHLNGMDEGVIMVANSSTTCDGRPLIWQNRESREEHVKARLFRGPQYDFIGIINSNDTTRVWMGLNTAGLALVGTPSPDHAPATSAQPGAFIKKALGTCGRLEHFENLLAQTVNAGNGSQYNFGCIDALDGAAVYEMSSNKYQKFDTHNPLDAPQGFLVRSNFSLTGKGKKASGSYRYHRANEILFNTVKNRTLDYQFVIRKMARDIKSPQINPYPLPWQESYKEAPKGFVMTENSLNRHNTVCSIVVHGSRLAEAPEFSTMWIMLGEPICTPAVPLWPRCGPVPPELNGKGNAQLNQISIETDHTLYSAKKWPTFINSASLVEGRYPVLLQTEKIEREIFLQVNRQLASWRQSSVSLEQFSIFQKKLISNVARQLEF